MDDWRVIDSDENDGDELTATDHGHDVADEVSLEVDLCNCK